MPYPIEWMYYCPREAHGEALKMIPISNESIDLTKRIAREELEEFVGRKHPLAGCGYCNGTNKGVIQAAVQG